MYLGLTTPAQMIDELLEMRREGWYRRRMNAIRAHLEFVQFHGRPILREPMSISAADACIKEAWDVVKRDKGGEKAESILHGLIQ